MARPRYRTRHAQDVALRWLFAALVEVARQQLDAEAKAKGDDRSEQRQQGGAGETGGSS